MIVCERCLEAIESHEGYQRQIKAQATECERVYGYYKDNGEFVKEDDMDDDDNNYVEEFVWCEWCESYELIENCYEI